MKKLSFAQNDIEELGLLGHGLVLREIDWTFPDDLAVVDLVELYLEIESGVATAEDGSVVQFIGASTGDGAAMTALDMAWAAVSILGKKLLVLNCTTAPWTRPLGYRKSLVEDVTVQPISPSDDLVKVSGHEMYMADVRCWSSQGGATVKADEIRGHLAEFRRYFDMVVVAAPAADHDPLGPIMARDVDGNVLVIEAERTRRSAAIRLRQILSRCGRPMLGTVLNDRQSHIPPWLARVL